MVVQHDNPAFNGCGAPAGEHMAAEVIQDDNATEIVRFVADDNGCFRFETATRPAMTLSSQAVTVAVKLSKGAQEPWFAVAHKVMFGHVILCAGQSNMVHPLSYDYNATAQENASHFLPNLRLFQVGRQWVNHTVADLPLGCHSNGTVPNLTPGCEVRNEWRPAGT